MQYLKYSQICHNGHLPLTIIWVMRLLCFCPYAAHSVLKKSVLNSQLSYTDTNFWSLGWPLKTNLTVTISTINVVMCLTWKAWGQVELVSSHWHLAHCLAQRFLNPLCNIVATDYCEVWRIYKNKTKNRRYWVTWIPYPLWSCFICSSSFLVVCWKETHPHKHTHK
jgi:hypothetical protein